MKVLIVVFAVVAMSATAVAIRSAMMNDANNAASAGGAAVFFVLMTIWTILEDRR